jgi:hypothetical protein
MSPIAVPNSLSHAGRLRVPRWRVATFAAGLALGLCAAPVAGAAQASESPRGPGYSDFRIISERNIFNQQRSPAPPASRAPRNAPLLKSDGLCHPRGHHELRKRLARLLRRVSLRLPQSAAAGDSIAGYRLASIELKQVVLTSGTNEVILPVANSSAATRRGNGALPRRPSARSPPLRRVRFVSGYSRSDSFSRWSGSASSASPPPTPPITLPPGGPEAGRPAPCRWWSWTPIRASSWPRPELNRA